MPPRSISDFYLSILETKSVSQKRHSVLSTLLQGRINAAFEENTYFVFLNINAATVKFVLLSINIAAPFALFSV